MDALMMRYRIKPDALQAQLTLQRDVYRELESSRPGGIRLATFRLDDELSFVDLAIGPDLPGPLPRMESFVGYRADLEARCEERAVTELQAVGSYGLD